MTSFDQSRPPLCGGVPMTNYRSSCVQHLVSVSGGKDSTATYLLALESRRPFRAVFADTGNEHPLTYEYVSTLAERTGGPVIETVRADFSEAMARHKTFLLEEWPKQGIPDDVVRAAAECHEPTGLPFLDLCILKGRFPSSQAQFCTEELKTNPIIEQIVLPMVKRGPVIQWIGQRREESLKRSKLPRANHHESGSLLWRPILEWRLPRVWKQHSRHGILPNPLYAMGFKRVGCYPCINCRKEEVRLIGSLSPEHIDRIERWEWVLGKASKRRRSSFFSAGTDPMDAEGAPIRQIVEWSLTGRGGRQFDMFFAAQAGAGCTSDLALCERAA